MNYLEAFQSVKGFIFDVDGVFTNSQILILEDGSLLRSMNTRDGYAVKRALEAGFFVGIITGGKSEGVIRRFRNLGVEAIYAGRDDKKTALAELLEEHNLDAGDLIYMGDDMLDLDVLRLVGLPCAPADAVPEVLKIARYVASAKGGEGCVREVVEKCLKVQECW